MKPLPHANERLAAGSSLAVLREIEVPSGMAALVIALTIVLPLMEGAGLGLLLPILVYVERGAADGYGWFGRLLDALGLPVSLPVLLAIAVVPLLLRQIVFYFKNVATAKVQYEHQARLRARHVTTFLRAALPFYIRTREGRVISALLVDSDRAATLIRAIADIAGCALVVLTYLVLLLAISPELTLLSVPLFGFAMLKIKRHLQRGRDFGRGIGQDSQEFSQIVTESLRGVRLIKMRGLEGVMIGRLREMANSLAKGQVELQRVRSLLEMTTQPILILGTFGVLYFAVEHLGMRLAELGMFMFLVTRSVPQLVQINNSRLAFYSALDSHLNMTRLSEEAAASRDVASGNAPFVGIRKKITFEDVGFNYSGDQADIPALANVSLSIERGQMVALVGPSGAGKSTLVDLIPRFYDPSTGRILIDGRPIGEYELSSLRRRIGFVMQDPVFFHDSIRANIEIGLEAPLDERKLRNCLAKSHAAEFVDRLRDGVETKIGERGLQLSAGQRQRLAIARALAQDPDILILDEPTSALDSVSESAIQASLEDLRGEITIVVIAHRLATIRNADLIVVLEGGRVADIGTHATLRSEGGTYERLVELQTI